MCVFLFIIKYINITPLYRTLLQFVIIMYYYDLCYGYFSTNGVTFLHFQEWSNASTTVFTKYWSAQGLLFRKKLTQEIVVTEHDCDNGTRWLKNESFQKFSGNNVQETCTMNGRENVQMAPAFVPFNAFQFKQHWFILISVQTPRVCTHFSSNTIGLYSFQFKHHWFVRISNTTDLY